MFLHRGPCIPNEALVMPTEEEVDVLLNKLGACLRPDMLPKDQRRCCFCHQQGDGQTDGPARLLNLDLDLWVSALRATSLWFRSVACVDLHTEGLCLFVSGTP